MKTTLTFNEMGINLTSELVEIGLIELTEQAHINWRLSLYEAIKSSDTDKVFTLINSFPKIVDSSVIIDMKKELVKIVPVSVLLERIEEFKKIEQYSKIKTIFKKLDNKGIKQFTMKGIDDDFPSLLDEYAGSDWRTKNPEQKDKLFFVLGECFSIYYR
ncbi:hypothetical protein [Rosenbergiella nectarea]|uniref:hypothetical protein n=1 Tax=Rosenbergiella nectarea TaxID=988801 RepID=UPI001F4E5643|nr:hypothetical protein [Rosenbergiella nectarea]